MKTSKRVRKLNEKIAQLQAYVRMLEKWHEEADLPDGWKHRPSDVKDREQKFEQAW